MAQSSRLPASKKRKLNQGASESLGIHHDAAKTAQPATLVTPHQPILAELSQKYDILPSSVISSSKIRQRTTAATRHLLKAPEERSSSGERKTRVVLLYARTDCLSKLVTIVEMAKRILGEAGRGWWQYNQLYEPEERKKKDVIEETVLEKGGDEEEFFETMGARLQEAILPEPKTRMVKSLRVFIATGPVAELKTKTGVTVQTSNDGQ